MSSVTKRLQRQIQKSPYPGRAATRRAIADAEAAFGGEPVGPEWVEPPPDPRLAFCPEAKLVRNDPDEDAPFAYSVRYGDDIIGAGATEEEALAEARAQVEEWARNVDQYIGM